MVAIAARLPVVVRVRMAIKMLDGMATRLLIKPTQA